MPSAAHAAVPGQDPQLPRTVDEAVSQAADLLTRLAAPVTPAPAPEPAAPAPAPAPRASSPAPPAAPKAPAAPVRQAGSVGATTSQNSDSPGRAVKERSSSPPRARSSDAQPADFTDATEAAARAVFARAADTGEADDEASLPFTGSRTVPLLMVAAIVLLAGIGLKRAIRTA
jgi:cobalamin biosynthesis Mg chelatase CobN